MLRAVRTLAIACLGFACALSAHAQWTYTDDHGSFYTLTISPDLGSSATTDSYRVTLSVNTTGNDDLTRQLNAAAIKVDSSYISAALNDPASTDGYTFAGTSASSSGCTGSPAGFLCAGGSSVIAGQTFTFGWDIVVSAGSLFLGDPSSPFSLKAIYDAGQTGKDGFYQVSVALVPEPSTYALMLAGLAAVGFMARRRRQG